MVSKVPGKPIVSHTHGEPDFGSVLQMTTAAEVGAVASDGELRIRASVRQTPAERPIRITIFDPSH